MKELHFRISRDHLGDEKYFKLFFHWNDGTLSSMVRVCTDKADIPRLFQLGINQMKKFGPVKLEIDSDGFVKNKRGELPWIDIRDSLEFETPFEGVLLI